MTTDTRKQVMAHIVRLMAEAEAQGREPIAAARATFPGTPDTVLYDAWAELDFQRTEAWWQTVEKTIDGEVITRALEKPQ